MCTFFRIASAAQYVTAGFEPIQLRGQLSDRTSTHTWAPSASEVRRQLAMCTLDALPRLSITTGSLGSSC